MHLTRLRLVQFRNHARTEVTPGPGINLFVGANAQGKSTLLEAVQLAATGRSVRSGRDLELIRWGETWARVRAQTQRADREEEIDVGLRTDLGGPPSSRAVKEFRVNGVPVSRGDVFGHLLVVTASPMDDFIVTGGPVFRRRLLDLLLAQFSPAYYYAAQRYGRVLIQRNRVLRERRAAALAGWDEQAAVLGASLIVRRRDVVTRLAEAATAIYARLCGGREALALEYLPGVPGGTEDELFDGAMKAFRLRRAAELARGATLVGPHRDDVRLLLDGHELRVFGSRGQQQMAMLAVRLAERQLLAEETGEQPVLLLDDVLMSLDDMRQRYLLEHLTAGQSLLTVTTLATLLISPTQAHVYQVAGGAVEARRAHAS
ncbi:MAG TPA: DNA replication/repair protein RecF [bacterium]